MASNSVKFNIEIGGAAYSGIAQLSEAMDDLNVKVNKTQGLFKSFGDAALRFNAVTDFIGKATSAFSGIAKAGMEVKTQLSERKGSVKEVFAVDDYTIDIKGVLIGHDGVLPCSQVQRLRDMYESKNRIELHNALTAYFLQEQKNVVITALNFYDQEAKDERHIPFSMTLISDYVETLEFI